MTATELLAGLSSLSARLRGDPRLVWAPRVWDDAFPDLGRHLQLNLWARDAKDAFSILADVAPVAGELGMGAHCEPTLTNDTVGWCVRVESWIQPEGVV